MTIKKALFWVFFWISLAMIFNTGVYFLMGKEKALEFFGGYIIEQSLSMDNLFLFLLIFTSFGIPASYQRKVLNYGILGAIILRLVFIVLGVAVVNRFHWVLYVFGGLLLVSGIKVFFAKEEKKNYQESFLLRVLDKIIPVTKSLEEDKFFVKKDRTLFATPLFAILVLIEGSDIVFAIDSIPAIFSITTDPLIVYTSNIFAIMGLRSMYFLLERVYQAFRYVKYGVALILTFTGVKLTILMFHIEIPLITSVLTIFAILALSIIVSLLHKEKTA